MILNGLIAKKLEFSPKADQKQKLERTLSQERLTFGPVGLPSVPVFEILEELRTSSVLRVRFKVRNASVSGEKPIFVFGVDDCRTNFSEEKLQWPHSNCPQLRTWLIHDKSKT